VQYNERQSFNGKRATVRRYQLTPYRVTDSSLLSVAEPMLCSYLPEAVIARSGVQNGHFWTLNENTFVFSEHNIAKIRLFNFLLSFKTMVLSLQ